MARVQNMEGKEIFLVTWKTQKKSSQCKKKKNLKKKKQGKTLSDARQICFSD